MKLNEYLKRQKVLYDGAFGTYYSMKYESKEIPELANEKYPERVLEIHREYLKAGATLIRTNTFASNQGTLACEREQVAKNIKKAYQLAKKAVELSGKEAFIAASIGPIDFVKRGEEFAREEEYKEIIQAFLEEGAEIFLFETFPSLSEILPVVRWLKEQKDVFIITQFNVNQFGYSKLGLSARKLLADAKAQKEIDACGFNCGIGPGHMGKILEKLDLTGSTWITAIPNAGYPKIVKNRMVFNDNSQYFAEKLAEFSKMKIDMLGGCCGTTPEYIRETAKQMDFSGQEREAFTQLKEECEIPLEENGFYAGKKKKLIAVELAPPFQADDDKLMEAAYILKQNHVDVLTFPDSPSGRTRADSILMAQKVFLETKIPVMPHLCCRDKNAIAMRSQLLGAHLNNIHNFLVITGDPLPAMVRQNVKSVFNFDSVGLMNIMKDMNQEEFQKSPIVYGGAINQTRKNLDMEIARVRKKMECGATFFLTQPVFDKNGANRLKKIKEETGARILCGIMPLVSRKNAIFMKNEMTGIEVTDEVIARYKEDATKEQGEAVGIEIAKEVITMTEKFVDGYYFSFPFNRVYLLEKILED